jgi:hypothetical protein
MNHLADSPLLVFTCSLVVLTLCAWLGANVGIRQGRQPAEEPDGDVRDDFNLVLTASLTLMGLIIGFTFSMAVSRYDQRKNYEEVETNAIGTAYLRAGLLPADAGARSRALLKDYLEQRLLFYTTTDQSRLVTIAGESLRLQNGLWAEVSAAAAAQPTPIVAQVIVSINDVFDSQSSTQAAWWNRIPEAAWVLMLLIAMLCNVMVGYVVHRRRPRGLLLLVLPLLLSVAFALIADIDGPRGGFIHVVPHDLMSLSSQLR